MSTQSNVTTMAPKGEEVHFYVAKSIPGTNCFITANVNRQVPTRPRFRDRITVDGLAFVVSQPRQGRSENNGIKLMHDDLNTNDPVEILAFFEKLRGLSWNIRDAGFQQRHQAVLSKAAKSAALTAASAATETTPPATPTPPTESTAQGNADQPASDPADSSTPATPATPAKATTPAPTSKKRTGKVGKLPVQNDQWSDPQTWIMNALTDLDGVAMTGAERTRSLVLSRASDSSGLKVAALTSSFSALVRKGYITLAPDGVTITAWSAVASV